MSLKLGISSRLMSSRAECVGILFTGLFSRVGLLTDFPYTLLRQGIFGI